MVEYGYKLKTKYTNRFVALVKTMAEAEKFGKIYTKGSKVVVDVYKVEIKPGPYKFVWNGRHRIIKFVGSFYDGKLFRDKSSYGYELSSAMGGKVKKKKKANPKNEWPYRFK